MRPDADPKNIHEELTQIRERQTAQGVELKWTKWLAAAAFAASTLGQLSNVTPSAALIDLGHVIWGLL